MTAPIVSSHQDPRRPQEVLDGAALAQKLRIRDDVEAASPGHPLEDSADTLGGMDGNRRLLHHHGAVRPEDPHRLGRPLHSTQHRRAVRPPRGPDADERCLRPGERLGGVRGEHEPTGFQALLDDLLQSRLEERSAAPRK